MARSRRNSVAKEEREDWSHSIVGTSVSQISVESNRCETMKETMKETKKEKQKEDTTEESTQNKITKKITDTIKKIQELVRSLEPSSQDLIIAQASIAVLLLIVMYKYLTSQPPEWTPHVGELTTVPTPYEELQLQPQSINDLIDFEQVDDNLGIDDYPEYYQGVNQ